MQVNLMFPRTVPWMSVHQLKDAPEVSSENLSARPSLSTLKSCISQAKVMPHEQMLRNEYETLEDEVLSVCIWMFHLPLSNTVIRRI